MKSQLTVLILIFTFLIQACTSTPDPSQAQGVTLGSGVIVGGSTAAGALIGNQVDDQWGSAAGALVGLGAGVIGNNIYKEKKAEREKKLIENAENKTRAEIMQNYWEQATKEGQSNQNNNAQGSHADKYSGSLLYPEGTYKGTNYFPRKLNKIRPDEPVR